MPIKQIKSDVDYLAAVERIDKLMYHAIPGTPEGDELELLSKLVEAYEQKTYPFINTNKGHNPVFDSYDLTRPIPKSKYTDKRKQ